MEALKDFDHILILFGIGRIIYQEEDITINQLISKLQKLMKIMDKIMNIKFREIRIFELPEMSEEELYDLILKFEEQGLIKIDEETQLHPMITDKFNNMLDEFNQVIENLLIFRENVP